MFTFPLSLFLDPHGQATDPPFEFHMVIASDRFGGYKRSDFIFVLMFVLASVFRMALLPEPAADLAVNLPELVTDDTTMLKLPEGLLQLPVSAGLLFVEPQAGFL